MITTARVVNTDRGFRIKVMRGPYQIGLYVSVMQMEQHAPTLGIDIADIQIVED